MKTYIVIIEATDEEDTFERIQDFIYNEFPYLEDMELIEQYDNKYRCKLTTENNFDYEIFEDGMYSVDYDTELVAVYR